MKLPLYCIHIRQVRGSGGRFIFRGRSFILVQKLTQSTLDPKSIFMKLGGVPRIFLILGLGPKRHLGLLFIFKYCFFKDCGRVGLFFYEYKGWFQFFVYFIWCSGVIMQIKLRLRHMSSLKENVILKYYK